MAYFPMYVNIEHKPCLIIGGGKVAYRKALVLSDFGAELTIFSKEFCDEIREIKADFLSDNFNFDMCDNKAVVVCATDDGEFNKRVSEYCISRRIPVNVVDDAEKSGFIFSSYIKEQNLVASYSSSGNSPLLTQILRQNTDITPFHGELNELLGKCRKELNQKPLSEEQKKAIYQKIYDYAISNNIIPTIEKVEEIIDEL